MSNSFTVILRGAALLAFLVAMPLCALPVVGKSYDAWLLGDADSSTTETGVEPALSTRQKPVPDIPVSQNLGESQSETLGGMSEALAVPDSRSESGADTQQAVVSQRLQELGAEYMRLESLAEQGGQFRFECRMALSGSSAYSRPFVGCGASPAEAMRKVLDDVEGWRVAQAERAAGRSDLRQR